MTVKTEHCQNKLLSYQITHYQKTKQKQKHKKKEQKILKINFWSAYTLNIEIATTKQVIRNWSNHSGNFREFFTYLGQKAAVFLGKC